MNELLAEAWADFATQELTRSWERGMLRILLDGPLAEVAPDDLTLGARRILRWLCSWDTSTALGIAELIEMSVLARDPGFRTRL